MRWLDQDNYKQHRDAIKSGDLLAWSGRSFVGGLVRVATASSWSHVGIAHTMGGRVWVIEAREFAGVQIVPLSSYLDCAWLPTGANWNTDVDSFAIGSIGKIGYSYPLAVRSWWNAAVGNRKPLLPNAKTQICSTFAPILLRKAGVPLPDHIMTPAQTVDYVIRLSSAFFGQSGGTGDDYG